ncbi:MAG: hypothetical protein KGZ70_13440 [Hydrogenophaga sp.]|nr:hypothetical protein [Hydrogenophaga sp.]
MSKTHIHLHEKTETERLLENFNQDHFPQVPLTHKGVIVSSVVQALIGTMLVSYVAPKGVISSIAFLVGLILMFLGTCGTLMASKDLMKRDQREKALAAKVTSERGARH